jgi:hypothetical protein
VAQNGDQWRDPVITAMKLQSSHKARISSQEVAELIKRTIYHLLYTSIQCYTVRRKMLHSFSLVGGFVKYECCGLIFYFTFCTFYSH